MDDNLLSLARQALGGDFVRQAGQFLGEPESGIQSALGAMLPAVVGSIAKAGASPGGARELLSKLNAPGIDMGLLDNIGGLFGGGAAGASGLMKTGTDLVAGLFGDKSASLVNAVSGISGLKTTSVGSLLAMAVPLVMGLLKKLVAGNKLDAAGLASVLARQGPHLQGALDPRITSALGFAHPAGFLGGLGTQAGQAIRGAGAAVSSGAEAMARGASGGVSALAEQGSRSRLLPWVLGAVGLLILFLLVRTCAAPVDKATITLPTEKTGAIAPPAAGATRVLELPSGVHFDVARGGFLDSVATSLASKEAAAGKPFVFDELRFSTGAAVLEPASDAQLKQFGALLKAYPAVKVSIGGHTDNVGDAAANTKLSQDRAESVKLALVALGVPAERITTAGYGQDKPVAPNDTDEGRAKNRRVEVQILQR
jgi:outer membrane protein OmpA-like peptidoglycan-associated protein